MQFAVDCEALDRGDLGAIVHGGKCQARIDALSVNQDGACATLALIAAFLCACKVEMLAQQVEKCRAGIERERMRSSVNAQVHLHRRRARRTYGRLSWGASRNSDCDRHHYAA